MLMLRFPKTPREAPRLARAVASRTVPTMSIVATPLQLPNTGQPQVVERDEMTDSVIVEYRTRVPLTPAAAAQRQRMLDAGWDFTPVAEYEVIGLSDDEYAELYSR